MFIPIQLVTNKEVYIAPPQNVRIFMEEGEWMQIKGKLVRGIC